MLVDASRSFSLKMEVRTIRGNVVNMKCNIEKNINDVHTIIHEYKHKIISIVQRKTVVLKNGIE